MPDNTTSAKEISGKDFATSGEIKSRKKAEVILPEIIGIPPQYLTSPSLGIAGGDTKPAVMDNVVYDTMPIMDIIPCEPTAPRSLELYSLEERFRSQNKTDPVQGFFDWELLNYYNIGLNPNHEKSLKVCFLASSLPVIDSFANDFRESMAQGFADQISDRYPLLRELSNITRADSDKAKAYADKLMSKHAPDFLTEMKIFSKEPGTKIGQLVQGLGTLVAGGRMDFPQIWKTSNWAPTYAVNVRLYNPFPGNPVMTRQHIAAPLTALLMFVVPRSEAGSVFKAPWMCKFKLPGMYNVQNGYIKDVTVVKGGDDNTVAYNQVPGIVDLKISFGVTYNTMFSGHENLAGVGSKPTLRNYIDPMWKDAKAYKGEENTTNGFSEFGPKWATTGYTDDQLVERRNNIELTTPVTPATNTSSASIAEETSRNNTTARSKSWASALIS